MEEQKTEGSRELEDPVETPHLDFLLPDFAHLTK